MSDKIELQNEEFKAAGAFAQALNRHNMTAVVDEDYPEVRHAYEGALANLIVAMRENGRFGTLPPAPVAQDTTHLATPIGDGGEVSLMAALDFVVSHFAQTLDKTEVMRGVNWLAEKYVP